MERHKWVPRVGVVLLTGAIMFSSDSEASSPTSQPVKLPNNEIVAPLAEIYPIPVSENEVLVKEEPVECTILFADGIGGSGHKYRDFFIPIAKTADSFGVSYKTVMPLDSNNPEKGEWTSTFRKQLEKEALDNKQVILMGYSMGAREVLELVAELVDSHQETYNPELASRITEVILVGTRDNDARNSKNHPELPNYAPHYAANPKDSNTPANISPEVLDEIKMKFGEKITIFGEPGDTITPEAQGIRLSSQIGAKYISVDVKNSNGMPDNHFVAKEAGIPIAQTLQTMILEKKCQAPIFTEPQTQVLKE